jgi:hypothetical protein
MSCPYCSQQFHGGVLTCSDGKIPVVEYNSLLSSHHIPPRHAITVRRLRELLLELEDDDELVPNQVRNLAILRNDKYFGFINLLEGLTEVEKTTDFSS